jgi:hypothetical protein
LATDSRGRVPILPAMVRRSNLSVITGTPLFERGSREPETGANASRRPRLSATHSDRSCLSGAPRSTPSDGLRLQKFRCMQEVRGSNPLSSTF